MRNLYLILHASVYSMRCLIKFDQIFFYLLVSQDKVLKLNRATLIRNPYAFTP